MEADLLLHVLDASSPNVGAQREAVYKILQQLGIAENRLKTQLVEVWNKSDLIESAKPLGGDNLVQSSSNSLSNSGVTAMSSHFVGEDDKQNAAERLEAQSTLSQANRAEEKEREIETARPVIQAASASEPRQVALDRRKAEHKTVEIAQQDLVWELIKVLLYSPRQFIPA